MGPLPPLTTNVPNAEQFIRDQEDPLLLEAMTEAVTLMPCAHTYNEQSVWMIPGFTGQNNPHPCEGGGARITKVRVVGHINCPMCHHPVDEYYRNWALRSVCLSLPGVFNNHPSINVPAPAIGPMPAPPPPAAAAPVPVAPAPVPVVGQVPAPARRPLSFKERFTVVVSTALGLLGATFGAFVFSEVKTSRGLFGLGAIKYDTSSRDHNMVIALFSSVVATTFIAATACVLIRRML